MSNETELEKSPYTEQNLTSKNKFTKLVSWIRSHKRLVIPILILLIITPICFVVFRNYAIQKAPITKDKTFELKESSPNDQDPQFSVTGEPTFVFTSKIGVDETNISKYFHITPSAEGDWHIEKNQQVVTFTSKKSKENGFANTLAYNTVYEVKIDKSLYSNNNKTLANDILVSFRTTANPDFGVSVESKLISTRPNQTIQIPISNFDNLHASTNISATVQRATVDQLLEYFKYKDEEYPLYNFKESPNSSPQPINSVLKNEKFKTIELDKNSFPKPGLYFVKLSNEKGSDDFFVAVSNHINQIFKDQKTNYVWVSDAETGKSLSGINTEFFQLKNTPELLEKSLTDNAGMIKNVKSQELVDFVVTQINDEIAISFIQSYGYRSYRADKQNYQTFSYTDRPVYRPGDLIHYKAVIRERGIVSYSIPNQTFYSRLIQGSYGSEEQNPFDERKVDQNGTIDFDETLPKATVDYTPRIELAVKKDDGGFKIIDSHYLSVESYKKPDMEITATAVEKEYISGDNAKFNVFAKTNFGSPLSNIEFSYRILLTPRSEIKDRSQEQIDTYVNGYYGAGVEFVTGTGKFDSKGVAQISFSTQLDGRFELSQVATLEITPKIGASPSIGKIDRLIHRGEFALFLNNIKTDIDQKSLSGTINVLNHNSPRVPVGNKEVSLSLYKYIDYSNKNLVDSQKVNSNSDGNADYVFTNTDSGRYEMVAQSSDERGNLVTARQEIYFSSDSTEVSNSKADSISIKIPKTNYNIDEIASLNVSANFDLNEVIILLSDTDGIAPTIVSVDKKYIGKNSFELPIKVLKEYGQVANVSVFTVNDGKVIRGVQEIRLNGDNKKINTKISFDKKTYKPGENVSALISTTDDKGNPMSADNSLSVIDSSILQIGRLGGGIYNSFYNERRYAYISSFDSTTGISRDLGGGGGGCFLNGTDILMSDGSTKKIENVKIGDKILTRTSDNQSQLVEDTITNTIHHNVTDYLTINDNLNVTWIHRIYLNNSWQEAGNAKIGDILLDASGNEIEIKSIKNHQGQFSVYNLTTSKYHTFFANGFYVHNDKGDDPRSKFVDTAFWNAHIKTNEKGLANVSFKLPDNLTTFTAQVISNSVDSKFGETVESIVASKAYNIIPNISNFYYQGDKAVISALMQNDSEEDFTGDLSLKVAEINLKTSKQVDIKKGDFELVDFDVDIGENHHELSFEIEAKSQKGQSVDSVLIKKPILARGNIASNWMSFVGSKSFDFSATYPDLDFNRVEVNIIPNVLNQIFDDNFYFSRYNSSLNGQKIYAYSYILAKTRDGIISPSDYPYAMLKNSFRDSINGLLEHKKTDHWEFDNGVYSSESLSDMNLWIAAGLSQAHQVQMLDQISNIPAITVATKKYVQELNKFNNQKYNTYTVSEQISRNWFLGEKMVDPNFQNTVEGLAIKSLGGDKTALGSLRDAALVSANDRLFWEGKTNLAYALPVLAMIEKGSETDAHRAIKGLSLGNNFDPMSLYAGVKYAERFKLVVEKPRIQVFSEGIKDYDSSENSSSSTFFKNYLLKNTEKGKLNLKILVEGQVPVYSTIVQSDYNNTGTTPVSVKKDNSMDTAKKYLNIGSDNKIEYAKDISLKLKRSYLNIVSGQYVDKLSVGESGIVVLTADNPYLKYFTDKLPISNSKYLISMIESVPPDLMFLEQTVDYSNSPQYGNVISKYFQSDSTMNRNVNLPSDFTDQLVRFDGYVSNQNIVLPYVVYKTNSGEYYQPKTSIIFKKLGIRANEN